MEPHRVTIPKRMRGLRRDSRGYPEPWILYRDETGKAHFSINDSGRVEFAKIDRLCSICGAPLLDQGEKSMWMIGGPMSALHPDGAYNDPAVHRLCGIYALRVCPYLALPSWGKMTSVGGRIAATIPPERWGAGVAGFHNPTPTNPMLAGRPTLFVFIRVSGYSISPENRYLLPTRPVLAQEFWRNGGRVADKTASEILKAWVDDIASGLAARAPAKHVNS